jgi:hypothetical protein
MKKQILIAAAIGMFLTPIPKVIYAQSDHQIKTELFKEGVKTIKGIYTKASKIWPHQWSVIKYSDGYCIFNRFRAERTIKDVKDHAIGNGDCDWWAWPEGSKHVCLDSYEHARALVRKHGKIEDIRWIDHPTRNGGN